MRSRNMGMYKLPLGIRVPTDEEYIDIDIYDVQEITKKRNAANIIQGFKSQEVHGEKYTHVAEINIDADKVWSLFKELARALINDTAYGIIELKGDEPIFSEFTVREKIIECLEEYKFELTNDGFLQFGIAYDNDDSTNQVFVTSYKYLQVWTTNKEKLLKVLKDFNLFEREDLGFIDGFPVVSEALSNEKYSGARHYTEVLEQVEKRFEEQGDSD